PVAARTGPRRGSPAPTRCGHEVAKPGQASVVGPKYLSQSVAPAPLEHCPPMPRRNLVGNPWNLAGAGIILRSPPGRLASLLPARPREARPIGSELPRTPGLVPRRADRWARPQLARLANSRTRLGGAGQAGNPAGHEATAPHSLTLRQFEIACGGPRPGLPTPRSIPGSVRG